MGASSKFVATVRVGDRNAEKTNGYCDEEQVEHNGVSWVALEGCNEGIARTVGPEFTLYLATLLRRSRCEFSADLLAIRPALWKAGNKLGLVTTVTTQLGSWGMQAHSAECFESVCIEGVSFLLRESQQFLL
jgi:hypothetical protein